jgi:hypothetical protein
MPFTTESMKFVLGRRLLPSASSIHELVQQSSEEVGTVGADASISSTLPMPRSGGQG